MFQITQLSLNIFAFDGKFIFITRTMTDTTMIDVMELKQVSDIN